jgi:hypothetical protein
LPAGIATIRVLLSQAGHLVASHTTISTVRMSSSIFTLILPSRLSSSYNIRPIQYNSQCISFPEWITLLTLCFAPLIAHIASGTPFVTYLTHSRPRWYDHLCHYNPTSIIWRYAAITDRRIRALSWNRNDLAASNAIFWTTHGWDGSEEMVLAAAPHCTRSPEQSHVRIVSVSMLNTVITTLQGFAALYTLIGSLAVVSDNSDLNSIELMGVDLVLFPVAILGLLRLCAAAWLTDDFEYSLRDGNAVKQGATTSERDVPLLEIRQASDAFLSRDDDTVKSLHRGTTISERDFPLMESGQAFDPFLMTSALLPAHARFVSPRSSWQSRAFRCFYLFISAGIWAVAFVFTAPVVPEDMSTFSTTSFVACLFYFVFITIATIIYAFYFFRGQTTSTLIPCISQPWYRVYTVLVMGFMVVLVVIASIETNRAPNGVYISAPPLVKVDCARRGDWWRVAPNSNMFSGFVSREKRNATQLGHEYPSSAVAEITRDNVSLGERYWLYNFTGFCVGQLDNGP